MSADNGIFIFQTPEAQFAVVHYTLSQMPAEIPELLKTKKTCYHDELFIYDEVNRARAKATSLAREFYNNRDILEYGVVDWSETSYADLMAPYIEEPVEETDEQMAARFQLLYKGG